MTACSHRKQPGRKPPSRACSVPDALPVTGKTVGFYSAGDRSGSQTVPGRVSGRNSGVMFRSALGYRFPSCRVCSAPRAVRDLSRLSGIVLRTLLSPSISFFGLCRRHRRIFDDVLPFTDGTNLCQYICYRGHLSRGGGQIRGAIHRQTEQSSRFSGRRGFPGGSDPEKQPGSLTFHRGEEGLRVGQAPKSSQEA